VNCRQSRELQCRALTTTGRPAEAYPPRAARVDNFLFLSILSGDQKGKQMRTTALSAVFLLIFGLACKGKAGSSQKAKATLRPGAALPSESVAPLTEEQLTIFTKVMPEVNESLKAAKWSPETPREDDGLGISIPKLVESIKAVSGVEPVLARAGTNWPEFRGTMYKVIGALGAINIEGAGPMIERLNRDTSAAGKRMAEQFKEIQAACSVVPRENKELVSKYAAELAVVQMLGQ
jgi:hypothetical protein